MDNRKWLTMDGNEADDVAKANKNPPPCLNTEGKTKSSLFLRPPFMHCIDCSEGRRDSAKNYVN